MTHWFRVCQYCSKSTLRRRIGRWLLPLNCPHCGQSFKGY